MELKLTSQEAYTHLQKILEQVRGLTLICTCCNLCILLVFCYVVSLNIVIDFDFLEENNSCTECTRYLHSRSWIPYKLYSIQLREQSSKQWMNKAVSQLSHWAFHANLLLILKRWILPPILYLNLSRVTSWDVRLQHLDRVGVNPSRLSHYSLCKGNCFNVPSENLVLVLIGIIVAWEQLIPYHQMYFLHFQRQWNLFYTLEDLERHVVCKYMAIWKHYLKYYIASHCIYCTCIFWTVTEFLPMMLCLMLS